MPAARGTSARSPGECLRDCAVRQAPSEPWASTSGNETDPFLCSLSPGSSAGKGNKQNKWVPKSTRHQDNQGNGPGGQGWTAAAVARRGSPGRCVKAS